jgi:retinol dehydrogenase-12
MGNTFAIYTTGEGVGRSAVAHGAALKGKYAVITGASSGIGLDAARVLAIQGVKVTMACRNVQKARQVVAEMAASSETPDFQSNLTVMELDLCSFASTRAFALAYLATKQPVHLLLCNAGQVPLAKQVTADGYEAIFHSCHLSHYLLFRLLTPRLLESAPARVILTSSGAHHQAGAQGWDWPAQDHVGFGSDKATAYSALSFYARAKLANIHMAQSISQRLGEEGIAGLACHPGVIDSSIWPWWFVGRSLWMKTVQQGSACLVYLAATPNLGSEFHYAEPGVAAPVMGELSAAAKNVVNRERLWEESEKIVKAYL